MPVIAPSIDKTRLLDLLRARVAADLEALERRQLDVQAGSTHEESRAEGPKDTRATEQSYLARGLATRVADTLRAASALRALEPRPFTPDDAIAANALVVIEMEEEGATVPSAGARASRAETWWIVAAAGGHELELGGEVVRTITPVSPLGRALLGLQAGDGGSFRTPRGERHFEVLRVS
jgi:transcription elongation GreA/GreB family factor